MNPQTGGEGESEVDAPEATIPPRPAGLPHGWRHRLLPMRNEVDMTHHEDMPEMTGADFDYMREHNAVSWLGPGLCDDCLRRKAEDAAKPGITASGGWVAPSLGLFDAGCYVIESMPFEDFLPHHHKKKITRKRALKAFRRWQRHEATVGQISHGYSRGIEFPEISVRRGDITYGNKNDEG